MLAPLSAVAGGPNIQTFAPNAGPTGLITTQGSQTVDPGQWRFSFAINYADRPLETPTIGISESLFTFNAMANIGLLKNLDAWIDVPYTVVQDPNASVATVLSSDGFGDMTMGLKWRAWHNNKTGISISPFFRAPTGDDTNLLGDESLGFGGHVIADHQFKKLYLVANAGYHGRQKKSLLRNLNVQHEFSYKVGAALEVHKHLDILAEHVGRSNFKSSFTSPLEVNGALRSEPVPGYAFLVGGGAGINKGYGAPKWRTFLQFSWTPQFGKREEVTIAKPQTPQAPAQLPPVHFAPGSTDLSLDSMQILDGVAETLKKQTEGTTVLVLGHADATGTSEHNYGLASVRAETVKRYLMQRGVPSFLLRASSIGETESLKHFPDDPTNRRVEFQVIKLSLN